MATSPSSGTRAVVDASVVVRGLVDRNEEAQAWLRVRIVWPSLVYAEVAHTVLRLYRNRVARLDEATRALNTLHALPADARPLRSLAREAWPLALARDLSVYDACYVALAEALHIPLVTADRRLAEATPEAVLLV